MSVKRSARVLAAVALVASAAIAVLAAPASGITVSDEAALRAAFADTTETSITLTADIDLTDCAAGDVTRPPASAPLTLSGAFTITQTCAGERVIGSDRDLETGALTVNDVTITGGTLADPLATFTYGGGILWNGDLTLNRTAVVGNSAMAFLGGWGGGVFVEGTLTANQSTISENEANSIGNFPGHGGALFVIGSATFTDSTIADNIASGEAAGGNGGAGAVKGHLVLLRTTVSGNVARQSASGDVPAWGGGIFGDTLDVIDSTVTANVAEGAASHAGGVEGGALTIAYSTIAGNSAAFEANLGYYPHLPTDTATIFASVVSDPLGGGANCFAMQPIVSQGYNHVTDDSCGLTATGDVQSGEDPLLGALANNGGLTLTRQPALTSPLLDRVPLDHCQDGAGAGVATDQRDLMRPQGAGCDVGAVEVTVTVSPTSPQSPTAPSEPPQGPEATTAPSAVLLAPRFTG
ncbi:MAG TPA: choice-of-anchor Q domain-containing protein [Acidimicrobiia bacterium]|nr:choice-of-anchor Q domain-containing protein [Acidimicrobiia bacterium]